MQKHQIKKLGSLLLALVLALSLGSAAVAQVTADDIDFTRTGSVSLTLKTKSDDETPVSGAEIQLIQVAKAENDEGSLKLSPLEGFTDFSFDDTDALTGAELPQKLADYVIEKELSGTKQTTADDGAVEFSDLELGLYLVMQTNTVAGYSVISPFLAVVPSYDETGEQWLYDVDGTPKAEVSKEESVTITVIKEWSDSNSTSRPTSVKVKLLRGTAVVETVTLGSFNNWSFTWENLEKSSQWSVQEEVPSGYTASYKTTRINNAYTFTITNTEETPTTPGEPNLPQTGLLNWPVPLLAGSGLLLFAIGFILVSQKKDKKDA